MSTIHAAPGASRHFLHFGRAFATGIAAVAVLAIALGSVAALIALRQSGAGGPGSVATHIYWATPAGSIGRANLDGTGVNDKFVTGLKSTCGVAVAGSHIYWTNNQDDTIGRANLDGTGVNQTLITGTGGACGLASDGSYLYWTTRNGSETGSIGRANLDGTGVNQSFIGEVMPPSLVGVAISGGDIYWGSVVPYVGRASLDVKLANGYFITLSAPPSGIAVGGGHVYWGNGQGTTIGRADLNGSGVNVFPTDGTYLYWTAAGKIGRANLDGTGVNQSFIAGISVPVGVAIGG